MYQSAPLIQRVEFPNVVLLQKVIEWEGTGLHWHFTVKRRIRQRRHWPLVERWPVSDSPSLAVPPEIPLLQASVKAWLREKEHAKPAVPPKIPLPPPVRPKLRFNKGPK